MQQASFCRCPVTSDLASRSLQSTGADFVHLKSWHPDGTLPNPAWPLLLACQHFVRLKSWPPGGI